MKQIILVNTNGTKADVRLIEEQHERLICRLSFPAYIGKNGAHDRIYEGSGRTPKGYFRVGRAFGYPTPPVTSLPLMPVDTNTYWVDDVNSRYYNRPFHGTVSDPLPFCSAERFCDYPEYRAGFIIEYNVRPILPGRGSAIFFHVGEKPTKGCIAAQQNDMERLLYWLKPHAHPHILIR